MIRDGHSRSQPSKFLSRAPQRGYTSRMYVMNHPLLFFPLALLGLFAAGYVGSLLSAKYADAIGSPSFKTIESSVLGLLALLLGFSFAMTVQRYDLRKQLEVGEANAIGTTWLRTSALDEPLRSEARSLLKQYVPARMAFFDAGTDPRAIADSLARTGALQSELWRVATEHARAHRDPYTTLYISSLNDTIDFSEKRTAAFEDRIPGAAWVLLFFIAAASSALVGIGLTVHTRVLLLVVPLIVAAALTLILDLDCSRTGFVQVHQNSMTRVQQQIQNAPQE
jgi:hypothetical protein